MFDQANSKIDQWNDSFNRWSQIDVDPTLQDLNLFLTREIEDTESECKKFVGFLVRIYESPHIVISKLHVCSIYWILNKISAGDYGNFRTARVSNMTEYSYSSIRYII